MYPALVALLAVMILTSHVASNAPKQESYRKTVVASVLANSFWAYRGAVVSYQFSNNSASGTVPNNKLVFPIGYLPNQFWSNTIEGGVLYTFSTKPVSGGVVKAIAERGGNTHMIGIVRDSAMISLVSGVSFIVPTSIPSGSVVVVGN